MKTFWQFGYDNPVLFSVLFGFLGFAALLGFHWMAALIALINTPIMMWRLRRPDGSMRRYLQERYGFADSGRADPP
jgi:hypothetical protein